MKAGIWLLLSLSKTLIYLEVVVGDFSKGMCAANGLWLGDNRPYKMRCQLCQVIQSLNQCHVSQLCLSTII